jgi:hypothetical protein
VEPGIFAFLLLLARSSTVAELFGQATTSRLVRFGFIGLIISMMEMRLVIEVVPPAPF